MKLEIAGKDRSADLGAEISAAASGRKYQALEMLAAREAPVMRLSTCANTDRFLDTHIELTHSRNCIETSEFDTFIGKGLFGGLFRAVKRFLWKVLRYQHDWMSFRQNAVNIQMNYQLKFEHEDRMRTMAELEERVKALEAKLAEKTGGGGGS